MGATAGAAVLLHHSRRRLCSNSAKAVAAEEIHPVTGLPPGPYPVGVTSLQLDDTSRNDPDGGPRSLLTEIWYPAAEEAHALPPNLYSEFLGRGAKPEYIARAEDADAIGGYRAGLTIGELDQTWQNIARRDARVRTPAGGAAAGTAAEGWPVVVFSHGNGAFRASYVYFTEFLASQGFVVVACDHPGSSRYTLLNGRVVKGGGKRAEAEQLNRPKDVIFLLDALEKMNAGADSRFASRLDMTRCAVTGMSFGGWTAAKVIDLGDPRIRAAVMQCPSLARGALEREVKTPVLMMIGTEDTVIGASGNAMARDYFHKAQGPRYLLEIEAGGHVTFTSCEQYNPAYGNGIGTSRSLTAPGATYEPLPPGQAHAAINASALAFLEVHLCGREHHKARLEQAPFTEGLRYDWAH